MTRSPLILRCGIAMLCIAAAQLVPTADGQNTFSEIPLDTGGWVSGFAQHPSGRLYGYGDIFGVYRSDDFGATWRFLENSIPEFATFVTAVTVSPTDANRVAFTATYSTWTSTDGGDHWTKRLGDLQDNRSRGSTQLLYHPTNANELWLASGRNNQSGTLWRSPDNGASWTPIGGMSFVNERAITIHIFPGAPNEIWVGTAAISGRSTTGGLWCSADSGGTWRKVWNNGGAVTTYYGAPQTSCIARNSSRVSLFSGNNGVWQVNATNWNDPQTYVATQRTFANQSIPNVTALADGTFWTSEIGDQAWAPKVSADGVNWTDRQIALSSAYVPEWSTAQRIAAKNRVYGREMLVQDVTNRSRWLLTGGAAAHVSEDNGVTWRYQPGGMAGVPTFRADFDRTNPGRAYLSASDHGLFVVVDRGKSGKSTYCSDKTFGELHTYHEALVSANGNTIVGAGVNQETNRAVIIRSDDGGANWSKCAATGLPDNYEGVTKSVMSLNDPNDFLVLLGFTDRAGQPNSPGLYRTTNGGSSFVKVGGSNFDGVDTGMRYHPEGAFLERDGVNPNIRYMALRASNKTTARGVWRSTDGGSNWVYMGGGWPNAFTVDPTIEGRLWLASGSLQRSDNGGASWVTVGDISFDGSSSGGVSAYGGRIAVLGRRPGDTFNKIYFSDNDGGTWREMTDADHRMNWAQNVSVDPWRPSQLWITGSRSCQLINPPSIVREVWNGIAGTSVAAIPTTTSPSTISALTCLEVPTNVADNYCTRIRGYITAPSTGSYTFWVAGDDNCELWLSTDSSPAAKVRIATVNGWTNSREWTREANQKSAPINLTAGQKYYVEVLHKEGGGGDNLAVGWAKPGESTTAPSEIVPGSVLSPFASGPENGAIYELEPRSAAGKRLDVSGAGTGAGTAVQLWTDVNGPNQRWKLEDQGVAGFELIPQHATGSRLDVNGAGTADGTKVQIWTDNNSTPQRWKFELQADGSYELIPQHDTTKRLKATGTGDGAAVQSWTDDNSSGVRWNLLQQ